MSKEQNATVARAAGFLMVTMVASRILGYLRDVFIYNSFGQNRITDAYHAAFSIPDFLYMIIYHLKTKNSFSASARFCACPFYSAFGESSAPFKNPGNPT